MAMPAAAQDVKLNIRMTFDLFAEKMFWMLAKPPVFDSSYN